MNVYDVRDALIDALEESNSFELKWETADFTQWPTSAIGLKIKTKNGKSFDVLVIPSEEG